MPCGLWLNAYTPKCYLVTSNQLIDHGRRCFQQYGKLTTKIWSEYVDDYNRNKGLNKNSHIGDIKWHGLPKSVSSRFGSFVAFKRLCGVSDTKPEPSRKIEDDIKRNEVDFEREWKKQFKL
ncbi:MAG: hypothetical protein ACFFAJ_09305 [Candidatus Hodarchaeota archaeon]